MTEGSFGYDAADVSPSNLSPDQASELPLRIPKNKSTGNLLNGYADHSQKTEGPTTRTRFSFDAGTAQEVNNIKRTIRLEHDNGLRWIRRGPPSRAPTLLLEGEELGTSGAGSTFPPSAASSRSASRSASVAHYLVSGPASPVMDDLHKFPSESLHSYSFARQSEDFLHSRQTILQKSVEFMQEHKSLFANPGLASAHAKINGNHELQGMMDLLKKAKVVPTLDVRAANAHGLGLGPMTGPADFEGRNIFDKSFSSTFEPLEEVASPTEEGELDLRPQPDAKNPSPKTTTSQMGSPPRADSPNQPRRLKRTYTDLQMVSLQQKLVDAMAKPYTTREAPLVQTPILSVMMPGTRQGSMGGHPTSLHSQNTKWTPPAQAVFRTGCESPWTIIAANDLACLAFGVTRAEVKSLSILGLIQHERWSWLEDKLRGPESVSPSPIPSASPTIGKGHLSALGSKGGITARLLSNMRALPKPPSNQPPQNRGVLMCGDILPTQKRDGTLGAASFWVMEKKGGLIWVVEEVIEDVAYLAFDPNGRLVDSRGDVEPIWSEQLSAGVRLHTLLPKFPAKVMKESQYDGAPNIGYYTASTAGGVNVPASVAKVRGKAELRVASLPHIAGVMVLEPESLTIKSSNAVFSASLFGYDQPNGLRFTELIPSFEEILDVLIEDEEYTLTDGLVIPEHSFRRARAILALREGKEDATNIFLRPAGLPARHGDGSDIMVDVQMRVVRSETVFPVQESVIVDDDQEGDRQTKFAVSELVYAVWITYSRQLHSAGMGVTRPEHPLISRPATPPSQPLPPEHLPSPPQRSHQPSRSGLSVDDRSSSADVVSPAEPLEHPPPHVHHIPHEKKKIDDFRILEEMGSGAYGQVKLARYKTSQSSKVVIKYVTKKKILVDTWTRDRRLGTVPLEIHVLDYLRQDGLQHPNIVEMIDFFEDNVNYYIEMLPHGIPGMDLFDYIELRVGMEEAECRSIFRQVVDAIHHLHIKAHVVHRDIKDENVVLDGEGRVKLIDFGSAAYIKNGPFDVFVGTIDYAAPEVLQGKAYGGKEQDVWAMGILLYTIVFKENPFYNIDEILDHPLRLPPLQVPYSDQCIELIKGMLNRDVEERYTIEDVQNHAWLESNE